LAGQIDSSDVVLTHASYLPSSTLASPRAQLRVRVNHAAESRSMPRYRAVTSGAGYPHQLLLTPGKPMVVIDKASRFQIKSVADAHALLNSPAFEARLAAGDALLLNARSAAALGPFNDREVQLYQRGYRIGRPAGPASLGQAQPAHVALQAPAG
jgi:hypothetical protein